MPFHHITCFVICVSLVFSEPNLSPKIIGGSDVFLAETYPYQVSLQDLFENHFCGGSIIDSSWVLTAAHCTKSGVAFKIVAGTIDRRNGTTKSVSSVKRHPLYNKNKHPSPNDIAVVRIVGSFTYSKDLQPIRLARELPVPGSYAVLTGWGRSACYGYYFKQQIDNLSAFQDSKICDVPILLQMLLVRVISLKDCKSVYKNHVTSTNVCRLNIIGEGACNGDSGSPIAFKGEQIGIVSYGVGCALGYADVDTNVPAFKQWISDTTHLEF